MSALLSSMLFRESSHEQRSAKEMYVSNVKTLILPGAFLTLVLTLLDIMPVSYTHLTLPTKA